MEWLLQKAKFVFDHPKSFWLKPESIAILNSGPKTLWNLKNQPKFLEELAKSKGLVFFPRDIDPGSRIVTETKLLNGKPIVNELVLHAKEDWFNKNVLEIEDEKIFDLNRNRSSLKISLFENELSIELETLYESRINCINDDLLIFYIRNENKILLMYKSYIPLLESNEPRLPFWEYIIEHPEIKRKFDEAFNLEDNLCIIGFSI